MTNKGNVRYLSPETMYQNPAYSNVVVATGPCKTIYIGGQNAVARDGSIVGDDVATQTEQVMRNVEAALGAGGAKLEHIVKWNVYLVQGTEIQPGLEVFQRVWGDRPHPPVITVLFVAGLANPAFLLEIDAIAVVPE